MKTRIIYLTVFVVGMLSCTKETVVNKNFIKNEEVNYSSGWFSEQPVNFEMLNTEYDDYNMDWPDTLDADAFSIIFSTNRKSEGENFDFISYRVWISYYNNIDSISFGAKEIKTDDVIQDVPFQGLLYWASLDGINNEYDQFGPTSFDDEIRPLDLFYSDNSSGNQDIKFIYEKDEPNDPFYGPFMIDMINTEFDECYPSMDVNTMYFCSNRENENFDIFALELQNEDNNLYDWLKGNNDLPIIENVSNLSSINDEKCPFVIGNLMVFASNDISGYGGYDLWYSIREDGEWQDPKNFGDRINSQYDEYRPVVSICEDSGNDIMVFSSNRPSGKGGFDLYYVGISKLAGED